MSHFLLAWEFGAGLGHLQTLRALADALQARGHRVSFALRDLARAHLVLGDKAETFQAPVWGAPPPPPQPVREYADLLARLGYLDSRAVAAFVRAWRHLVAILEPDVVVAEYAPTALLATHGMGLPRAMIGTGFSCPPPVARLSFEPGQPLPQRNPLAERVLGALNAVQRAVDGPALRDLGSLHAVDRQFPCTWAELDPFATARGADAEYFGPLGRVDGGRAVAWRGQGPRIFAYLKPAVAATGDVLGALAASGAEVVAYVPGASNDQLAQLDRRGVRAMSEPVSMSAALDDCALVVCHAGHGTTCAALLAGVPVLLVPAQSEQALTARSVAARGLGHVWVPGDGVERVRALLADEALRALSRAFAACRTQDGDSARAERVARELEALAGKRPG